MLFPDSHRLNNYSLYNDRCSLLILISPLPLFFRRTPSLSLSHSISISLFYPLVLSLFSAPAEVLWCCFALSIIPFFASSWEKQTGGTVALCFSVLCGSLIFVLCCACAVRSLGCFPICIRSILNSILGYNDCISDNI